jgi:hypothetical protein|eukprot:COSAG06_NODE_4897_length_3875_cov_4.224047_4_plen_91_part_00
MYSRQLVYRRPITLAAVMRTLLAPFRYACSYLYSKPAQCCKQGRSVSRPGTPVAYLNELLLTSDPSELRLRTTMLCTHNSGRTHNVHVYM